MNADARLSSGAFGSYVLDELAEVIGEAATKRLARQFAGVELYVPKKIGINHPITAAIGAEAAAKLARHVAGGHLDIPRAEDIRARHEKVRRLHETGGLTIAAIARETGYSERWIYKLLADAPEDDQLDLFG